MGSFERVVRQVLELYTEKRVKRASAALSYYLTMSIFPLIICLYGLLDENYDKAIRVLGFLEQFLSAETIRLMHGFLLHVAISRGGTILIAGLTVLLTTASAAVRTLQSTIGEMQGGQRFQGLMGFLFSVLFSLVFLAATYFAIVVMLTGRDVLELINGYLPFVDVRNSWQWLRFVLLAGNEFVILWGVYEVSKRRSDQYRTLCGALFATAATVIMSFVFSVFIAASARYPLVYGSLASMILLMLWLYMSCQIIFVGAAVNVAMCEGERDLTATGGNDTMNLEMDGNPQRKRLNQKGERIDAKGKTHSPCE